MALDQQTLQVLQEISASIRSIHILMQQSSTRQQSATSSNDPSAPDTPGHKRPGPADWVGQNISGISSLNYRQHYPSPYSYPGMAGHMSHMGMGMMGMGMGMYGHMLGHQRESGDPKQDLVGAINKLIDTLEKFSDGVGILNRVGGEASGTSGKKAKAKSYASLKDKWEDEYAQISASKVFGDAKARLDKARQKYFDDKEWSEMPFSQRMGRRMGNLGSGLGRLGNMGVNFLGALGHTEGKDPALGNASQSLSKSLMGIGGKLGAFGNALGVITSSLQSMKAFADSAHRMNMRLSEWSPSMARVAVYSEIEQIMSDQRKGEARAESAMRVARARAQMTRDSEELQNDIANLSNTIAEGAYKTVGFLPGLYGDFKFRTGLMSPEQQNSYLEKLAKDDPEVAKMLGTHGKEFSEGVKDIMNSKWIEVYGAPAHWKNWTDD